MRDKPSLGEWIKNKRKELGIGQMDLAAASGISQTIISKLESGSLKGVRSDRKLLVRVAAALGVDAGDMLDMIPEGEHGKKFNGIEITVVITEQQVLAVALGMGDKVFAETYRRMTGDKQIELEKIKRVVLGYLTKETLDTWIQAYLRKESNSFPNLTTLGRHAPRQGRPHL